MKYFFVLGNNPTLSIAEITTVFSGQSIIVNDQILILDSLENIQPSQVITRLGGTIKLGVINSQVDRKNYKKILKNILQLIEKKEIVGKFKFGISCYGVDTINEKKLGLTIKKNLQDKGISCRWVVSNEATLSSVVVEQNKLIDKGMEIILIKINNKILIGQTLAVQPFKQLSFRDYGRPARDDLSGMLPPKLAQIMLNLAKIKPNYTILDPFCGSGTILTEAMLINSQNVIGADISSKAIKDTKKNIEWITTNYKLPIINYQLFNVDVTQILKHVQANSIDAIVTEPYLGPQRGKIKIEQVVKELNNLYSQTLIEFDKILKSTGRIVMVWPVFCSHQELRHLNPILNNFKIINPILKNLQQDKRIKLTERNTIIYGREQQKIWREIVILEKFTY
ncbi:methyltransferase domain-containing protein [Patescibacteria group bacterium]|nr:methyltransferase domain-containing protein [Patescibacteria group bacterium]MBU1870770.1 methyltransferase domain-containing protein [Patescibacteria group bacterium]